MLDEILGRIRDLAQKIMVTPWEVDQNLYCTPSRAYSESATARKISAGLQQQIEARRRRSLTLFHCISDQDAAMSTEVQAQCLPVDLRGDRRTIKLIKVCVNDRMNESMNFVEFLFF